MSNKNSLVDKINSILSNNIEINDEIIQEIKKKRGRKSNKELEVLKKYNENKKLEAIPFKTPKKRGRKPKGGKLIKPAFGINETTDNKQTNIILHLKCNSTELGESHEFISQLAYNPNIEQIQAFNEFDSNNLQQPQFFTIEVEETQFNNENTIMKTDTKENNDSDINMKIIWQKLKELRNKFNKNSISDKKSSCFWCTCDFDWPPIHIPKSLINDCYEVYGCFCMPECAVGHLFSEGLDCSTKWERYAMLNNMYVDIYNYEDNIKPSPDPRYLLKKYYGELSIEEYRLMIRKGKHRMLVVNKPLTHILPELVEDSIDNTSHSSKQYRLSRNKPSYNKLNTNQKSWAF